MSPVSRTEFSTILLALFCAMASAHAPDARAISAPQTSSPSPTQTKSSAPGDHRTSSSRDDKKADSNGRKVQPGASAATTDEIARRAASGAGDVAGAAAGMEGASENAYDALARDLLLRIELIEMDKGHIARELETPLFELGKLYLQENQCQNAIPIIQRAILLSQRLDGVMSPTQLRFYEPLLECFVARDMIIDLERALDQTILVNESTYGKDDIRTLPSLAHAAQWYEQAGLYDNARQLYTRSIRIAQELGGKQDVRTVDPMRGMARTYRLEAQYAESVRSGALNAAGERTLERAANIVRMNPTLIRI